MHVTCLMTSVHNPRNFRWNTDSAIYVRLNVPTHFHVESNFTVICHFLFALLWFKVALFSALKITNSHFYCIIPHLKHFTLPRIGFLSWVLVSADVVVQVQVSHRWNTFFVFLLLLATFDNVTSHDMRCSNRHYLKHY